MNSFKQYRRTGLSEMRPVTADEARDGLEELTAKFVSISQKDADNGSPKLGDMIARNPKSHKDQWLVAEKYFNDNLEEV